MRVFQTLGLAPRAKLSLVGMYRHYDAEWRPVMEMDLQRGLTEQGWQSDYMFHQPDFEAVLRGCARGSTPERRRTSDGRRMRLTTVRTTCSSPCASSSAGEQREFRAAFVVGCDGANSWVREQMGVDRIDYQATHRSLILDILPFVTSFAQAERS